MRARIGVGISLLWLYGCSNEFEEISDHDLADSMYECRSIQDQSPGMAIRCDNVVRECDRRREDGRFVC